MIEDQNQVQNDFDELIYPRHIQEKLDAMQKSLDDEKNKNKDLEALLKMQEKYQRQIEDLLDREKFKRMYSERHAERNFHMYRNLEDTIYRFRGQCININSLIGFSKMNDLSKEDVLSLPIEIHPCRNYAENVALKKENADLKVLVADRQYKVAKLERLCAMQKKEMNKLQEKLDLNIQYAHQKIKEHAEFAQTQMKEKDDLMKQNQEFNLTLHRLICFGRRLDKKVDKDGVARKKKYNEVAGLHCEVLKSCVSIMDVFEPKIMCGIFAFKPNKKVLQALEHVVKIQDIVLKYQEEFEKIMAIH